jgi:hypothetical protein
VVSGVMGTCAPNFSVAGWLAVVVLQLRHAVLHRRIPDPDP